MSSFYSQLFLLLLKLGATLFLNQFRFLSLMSICKFSLSAHMIRLIFILSMSPIYKR